MPSCLSETARRCSFLKTLLFVLKLNYLRSLPSFSFCVFRNFALCFNVKFLSSISKLIFNYFQFCGHWPFNLIIIDICPIPDFVLHFLFTFYCKEHTLEQGYFLQPNPNYYIKILWLGKGVLNVFSVFWLFIYTFMYDGFPHSQIPHKNALFHQLFFIKIISIFIWFCMSSLHIYFSIYFLFTFIWMRVYFNYNFHTKWLLLSITIHQIFISS